MFALVISPRSQNILVIPEFIIPLVQSEQGIPQDRYMVQPLVDTPILAVIYPFRSYVQTKNTFLVFLVFL